MHFIPTDTFVFGCQVAINSVEPLSQHTSHLIIVPNFGLDQNRLALYWTGRCKVKAKQSSVVCKIRNLENILISVHNKKKLRQFSFLLLEKSWLFNFTSEQIIMYVYIELRFFNVFLSMYCLVYIHCDYVQLFLYMFFVCKGECHGFIWKSIGIGKLLWHHYGNKWPNDFVR